MELFLTERYNRVLQVFNLYMKQPGCHRGLRGLCLRGCLAKHTFWFWIRNPKSKRNVVQEILDNLLFSYWLLVVGTIISNSNLSAWWQFDAKYWCETTRSWKAMIYTFHSDVFWRSSEYLAPDEWWLSSRAIRDIAPLSHGQISLIK